jgi:hypothetical protein
MERLSRISFARCSRLDWTAILADVEPEHLAKAMPVDIYHAFPGSDIFVAL